MQSTSQVKIVTILLYLVFYGVILYPIAAFSEPKECALPSEKIEEYLFADLDEKQIAALEEAGKKGDASAWLKLGYYNLGTDDFEQFYVGVRYLDLAAKAGDLSAAMSLADIFADDETEKDAQKHLYYLVLAAKARCTDAYLGLADYYLDTEGDYQPQKAEQYLKNLLHYQNAAAAIMLGNLYAEKKHNKKANGMLATDYYLLAAKWGDKNERLEVGEMLFHNQSLPNHYQNAFKILSEEEFSDNAIALYYMGVFYLEGLTGVTDISKGIGLLQKSESLGDLDAAYELGIIYSKEEYGIPLDYQAAIEHFEVAAKLGNVKALYMIGSLYEEGLGVPKNSETAFYYYQIASGMHDADAKYSLALFFNDENSENYDVDEAIFYATEAFEYDNINGAFLLVEIYKNMGEQSLMQDWLTTACEFESRKECLN